mgnify:CR=1 FL=1
MSSSRKPNDIARQGSDQKMQYIAATQWSSPLPPPELLAKYKEVAPEYAEIVVQMLKKEQEHRHDMDRSVTEAMKSDNVLNARAFFGGYLLFWLVCAASVWIAYLALMKDNTTVAVVALGVPSLRILGDALNKWLRGDKQGTQSQD